jgi:hypothetical protein
MRSPGVGRGVSPADVQKHCRPERRSKGCIIAGFAEELRREAESFDGLPQDERQFSFTLGWSGVLPSFQGDGYGAWVVRSWRWGSCGRDPRSQIPHRQDPHEESTR